MSRNLALGLAATAGTILALLALRSLMHPAGESAPPARATERTASDEAPDALDEVGPEERKRVDEPIPTVAAPPAAVPEEPAAPPTEPAPLADLEETQALEIRVVDADGAPVMDARVWIMGHRTEAHRGAYFTYRGDEPSARTDFDGRVRLDHFAWVTSDGRVSAVDLHVEHAEYVQFRDAGFPVDPDVVHEVTLERGGIVALTAWIGDASRPVTDVRVSANWESKVADADWTAEPAGRRTTDKFPAGEHRLRVAHGASDGTRYYSDFVDFRIEAGGFVELFVELHPAARFEGRLGPEVPRPVVGGVALLGVHALEAERGRSIGQRRETKIDADGQFVFENVPAGEGQLVVLCEGWVVRKAPLLGGRESGGLDETWPRVEVPGDGPHTIAMERTGTVEVTVIGPGGEPFAGASVTVNPNYRFWGIGSSIVPGREWRAETGPNGIARIADVPPTPALSVGAWHDDHRMVEAARLETPSVAIASGERATLTIELEEKP
ncbi:MAG: carboxypeptidase-like regulatory domain-containing protein [Planctomycetota bacterium]